MRKINENSWHYRWYVVVYQLAQAWAGVDEYLRMPGYIIISFWKYIFYIVLLFPIILIFNIATVAFLLFSLVILPLLLNGIIGVLMLWGVFIVAVIVIYLFLEFQKHLAIRKFNRIFEKSLLDTGYVESKDSVFSQVMNKVSPELVISNE